MYVYPLELMGKARVHELMIEILLCRSLKHERLVDVCMGQRAPHVRTLCGLRLHVCASHLTRKSALYTTLHALTLTN